MRYRYRTDVLLGPWREARRLAVLDAVHRNLARIDPAGDELEWVVPGTIEAKPEEAIASDRA